LRVPAVPPSTLEGRPAGHRNPVLPGPVGGACIGGRNERWFGCLRHSGRLVPFRGKTGASGNLGPHSMDSPGKLVRAKALAGPDEMGENPIGAS